MHATTEQLFQTWNLGVAVDGDPVDSLTAEVELISRIRARRPTQIRNARRCGATWEQIAVVVGMDVDALRSEFIATVEFWESEYPGLVEDVATYRAML